MEPPVASMGSQRMSVLPLMSGAARYSVMISNERWSGAYLR